MHLTSLLFGFGAWNWLFLAILLFTLETMIPGVHFLWFGIAATLVGVLALTTGIAWPWQVLAFGIIAVTSVFLVRRYVRPDVRRSDLPGLNERGQQYIGRSLIVEQAIRNGRGKVRVDDTLWQAEGPDTAAGSRVIVTAANGTVLVVERATSSERAPEAAK
jgi:membrane protein implicated in regulation of membrane protease activity